MTPDSSTQRTRTRLAIIIVGVSLLAAFAIYVDALTPPSRGLDLLALVIFFPLIYPIAPIFLEGAFGLGIAAYATYPVIALALALLVGSTARVGLAAAALLTVYMLPWTDTPALISGYQAGYVSGLSLGLGALGQVIAIIVPILALAALIAPRQTIGAACLLGATIASAVLMAGTVSLTGFGGLTVGGFLAVVAFIASAAIALNWFSARDRH